LGAQAARRHLQEGMVALHLVHFGGCAPRLVVVTRLGQQVAARDSQSVGQIEQARTFGDQGPVPWSLAGIRLENGFIEGPGRLPHVAERPRLFCFHEAQQMHEVIGLVGRAAGEPAAALLQIGKQLRGFGGRGPGLLNLPRPGQCGEHKGMHCPVQAAVDKL
jgi:hypothetical protein